MRTSAFHRKSIAAEQEEYPLSLQHAPLSGTPAYVLVSDCAEESIIGPWGGWLVVCERSCCSRLVRPANNHHTRMGRDCKDIYMSVDV